jgi:uracil-DNA glycosylase
LGDWQTPLKAHLETGLFRATFNFVQKEYNSTLCFPPRELIFNAFNTAKFSDLKVVIVGQDPYIKVNEAMGMSFSVPRTTKCPPSL